MAVVAEETASHQIHTKPLRLQEIIAENGTANVTDQNIPAKGVMRSSQVAEKQVQLLNSACGDAGAFGGRQGRSVRGGVHWSRQQAD